MPPLDPDTLEAQLLEAWQANNRINLLLIDEISEKGLRCTLSTRGGRDVARQLAHLHNVRVDHLKNRAKELSEGLTKFESKVSPTRAQLKKAFKQSGKKVETFLADVLQGRPKRRGFKRGIFTSLSYFIAHESHHRGSILLTLKQSGHKLDQDTSYGIWAWDNI